MGSRKVHYEDNISSFPSFVKKPKPTIVFSIKSNLDRSQNYLVVRLLYTFLNSVSIYLLSISTIIFVLIFTLVLPSSPSALDSSSNQQQIRRR